MTHAGTGPILVVADDLTGANATAAGLSRARLRAVTVTDPDHPEVVAEFAGLFDAVVVSANNRHVKAATAAEQVRRVLRSGWPATLVANRIDSTLRGNVGATTEALVDELARLSGERVVALCVPAHPDAHRQTVGGVQLLAGNRLEDTEVARDARQPMTRSDVAGILATQTALPVAAIGMDPVVGAAERLVAALTNAVAGGARIVVADALTVDHVERIAAAAAAVPDVRWLCVDPGPATVAMARAQGLGRERAAAPYLLVSGSATDLTRRQLARVRAARGVVPVRPLLDEDGGVDVDGTARRLAEALAERAADVVMLASVLEEGDLVEGPARGRIPAGLARATRRALEESRVSGLFATGGDVAAACLAELGADGLDVADEVVPLAVGGTLVGGPWSGLPVVTKGGLVGDDDTTLACLDFLARAADAARRHVPAATSRIR